MNPPHVALVLAAGGSRRLGQPKQLLTRDGETLVHRAARLACGSGAQHTWAVVGAHRDAVIAALRGLPCDALDNPDWASGLASSLRHAGPRIVEAGHPVLVLACDQPALDAAHLQSLLDAAAATEMHCAATRYGVEPGMPAVLPSAWFADGVPASGDQGFRARLRSMRTSLAHVAAPEALALDLDTAEDLARARALGLIDAG